MISFEETGTRNQAFRKSMRKFLYALTLPGKKQDVANIPLSGVLRKKSDFKHSIKMLDELNLPLHNDGPKNWDCLAALSLIQRYFPNKSAKVLDAGGEFYSPILRQLELSGYTDLTCINLVFKDRFTSRYLKKGNILFEYGDITKTKYPDGHFDAITCLSVIEHGVGIEQYFKEMSRLLKVNGVLFTSTDYWDKPIDTAGKVAYGVPVKIFDANDINEMIRIAERYGFKLIEPLVFDCDQKVVTWKEFDLRYTFIYFSLVKMK